METLNKLFLNSSLEPSERLYGLIHARIARIEVRRARLRLLYSGSTTIVSAISLIPLGTYAYEELVRTGFLEYFSLLFSDIDVVAGLWQHFALLLAGSLPILALSAVLTALLAFTISLRSLLRVPFARLQTV